jgi:LuxR family transcriptional regulator, maltose regulon positive regulatory protein
MVPQHTLAIELRQRPVPVSRRVVLPPLCSRYLPRARLYDILLRNPDSRLAVIVAPAGFGKTTLLNAWTRDTSTPVAWLSLTAADGHLRTFIHGLMTAVQTVIPKFGDGVLSLLLMDHPPPADIIAMAIARELANLPHDLMLVLDAYEAIGDMAVHQLLGALLEHIPTNVHVVIASRTTPPLPLARLRVRGQLTEIGPSELRFRPDETEALVTRVAERELPASVIRTLNERLDGWPSLLGLVTSRLEQPAAFGARVGTPGTPADPDTWEDALRQVSDRDIEAFLIEEILESQPPNVQDLLLRTSLVDAFSAELCDALLQPEAAIAGTPAVLDRLERQHLLIESVDESGTWYRCPRIVRDTFRRRLQHIVTPLEMKMLRRRACEWLAARGMVDEAIEQALACGDTMRVAELVEGNVASLLARADYPTLNLRLGKLPPDLVASRPRLILARAWLLNFFNRFEAIPTVLARLDAVLESNEHGLAEGEVEQLRAEGAVLRAVVATVAGDGQQVLAMARRAYDALPRFSSFASGMAAGYVGIGQHLLGETDAATALLEGIFLEDPEAAGISRVVALWALALVSTTAARPRAVIRWAGQLVHEGTQVPEHAHAWGQHLQGLAFYELNRLSEARDCFLDGDRHRHPAHRLTLRNTLLGLSLVEQASGDLAAAAEMLRALRDMPDIADAPSHLAVISVFEARLACALGEVEAGRELLAGAGAGPLPIMIESISGSPSLVRARILIALGSEDDLAEAARLLDALEAGAASINDQLQMIGVQAARALLCQARADTNGALRFLERAIASATPNGLVRTFVDLGPPMQRLIFELDRRSRSQQPYLSHLLAAFPAIDRPAQQPSVSRFHPHLGPELTESMTWREAEILRLLDARLSNQEIAGMLLISSETVKKHTSNIYQKLGVTGRREAVARSYALGILPAATPPPPPPVPDRPPAPLPDQLQA